MNYAQIRKYDIANGEGIRTTLFVSGCNFFCKNCFNKEYQSFEYGEEITENVISKIKDNILNENVRGLSILGGEPFHQSPKGVLILKELCDFSHSIGKDVWIWTGFTIEELLGKKTIQPLLNSVDVLIDGRFEFDKSDMNLKWRGSSNQRIIDVKKYLVNNFIDNLKFLNTDKLSETINYINQENMNKCNPLPNLI